MQFTPVQMDRLQEEFTDYQLLDKSEVPEIVWKEALIFEDETGGIKKQHHRMDTVWGYLAEMKNCGWVPQVPKPIQSGQNGSNHPT